MKIENIELLSKVEILNINFSNTFFNDVRDKYKVVFKNSNVIEEIQSLEQILFDYSKKRKSFLVDKEINMVEMLLDVYSYLITVYKHLTNLQLLSPKLKRYELIKYLQDYVKEQERKTTSPELNSRIEEKIDSINEVINPKNLKLLDKKEAAKLKAEAVLAKKELRNRNKK